MAMPSRPATDIRGGTLRDASILVVEDSPSDRLLIRDALTVEGAAVRGVGLLMEALELLALHPTTFDGVVLDLHLPDSAGLSSLRTALHACGLPIVVYSANVDEEIRRWAMLSGATALVDKREPAAALVGPLAQAIAGRRPAMHGFDVERDVDHDLFGTLCGIDPEKGDETLRSREPFIAHATAMLSEALTIDLERDRLQRSAELASLSTQADPDTGLPHRGAFELALRMEQRRSTSYGDVAGVTILRVAPDEPAALTAASEAMGEVAAGVRHLMQGSDLLFRLGPNDLGVLRSRTSPAEVEELVRDLRLAMGPATVPVAVGGACQVHGGDLGDVVALADWRMHEDAQRLRERA